MCDIYNYFYCTSVIVIVVIKFVYYRLREAGLLAFCSMIQGGQEHADGVASYWMRVDKALLTALVDRWRPETHTFHLPCGEIALTLEDVAYLLGLPLDGDAVGPRVVQGAWLDDLEGRFVNAIRWPDLEAVVSHPRGRQLGPQKGWLLLF